MPLPMRLEAQNHRALNAERCLSFKSSEAVRQEPHLLQTRLLERCELMQTVNVDMHFRVTGAENLDRLTNEIFEQLLTVENSDPAISNAGLQTELETGKLWIQVAAQNSDFSRAANTGSETILRAIRAATAEPVEFELLEQNVASAA